MYKDKRIGVVVPAYNEAHLIARVVETMPAFVDHIYVVDDVSQDGTAEVVRGLIDDPRHAARLTLIVHEKNQGVGGTIITGYKRAVTDKMDVIAVMAGDAQMDPDDLENVINPVVYDEADYVKGNRLFTGEAWKKIPHYRYLGNSALSMMTKIASGYWHVADSQTGYTAISREALEVLPIKNLYRRYGYPNHMLVMLNVYGFQVIDVPVKPVYNIGEKSGIRLHSVIPRMSWLLFKQFLWRMKEKYVIRDFHPLLFFYIFGSFLLLLCFGLSVRLCLRWYTIGYVPEINALACMFTAISGIQFVLFAMWFDMEYEPRRPMADEITASPANPQDAAKIHSARVPENQACKPNREPSRVVGMSKEETREYHDPIIARFAATITEIDLTSGGIATATPLVQEVG